MYLPISGIRSLGELMGECDRCGANGVLAGLPQTDGGDKATINNRDKILGRKILSLYLFWLIYSKILTRMVFIEGDTLPGRQGYPDRNLLENR